MSSRLSYLAATARKCLSLLKNLAYCRNKDYRTAKTSLPFKVLAGISVGNCEMVGLGGETSNTLFDTLEEWNAYLKAEDIDLNNLEIQSDIKRHPIRRGPSL
ncbi:MAG TPA: hypothetical protein ENK61_00915 [Devosia sp.]|nr:hypothetical protein [Devosia sp.]